MLRTLRDFEALKELKLDWRCFYKFEHQGLVEEGDSEDFYATALREQRECARDHPNILVPIDSFLQRKRLVELLPESIEVLCLTNITESWRLAFYHLGAEALGGKFPNLRHVRLCPDRKHSLLMEGSISNLMGETSLVARADLTWVNRRVSRAIRKYPWDGHSGLILGVLCSLQNLQFRAFTTYLLPMSRG